MSLSVLTTVLHVPILEWPVPCINCPRAHPAPVLTLPRRRRAAPPQVEKVAFVLNDPSLMLLLYAHTNVEMDLRVLAFLIHAWASQPVGSRKQAASHAGHGGGAFSNGGAVASLGLGLGGLSDLAVPLGGEEEGDEGDGLGGAGPEAANVAAEIEQFLVNYVVRKRNPLSVTAAILTAIQVGRS